MNHKFKVDENKCIKCGLCVNDCLTGALEKNKDNLPFMKNPLKCIKCQHCFAICPNGAISIMGKNPEDSAAVKQINPDDILNLIQTRRSTRNYKQENVPKETIEKLKAMLNYVPTGCNFHKLHFSFIEDINVMDEFRVMVNNKLISLLNTKTVKFFADKLNKFAKYKDGFLNGEDVIFRGAPHLVVVSAPIESPCINQDGIIALSYFELYAKSLGLSTLWCGFCQAVLKLFPSFCAYLQIPKGYQPVYVMLFGIGNIEYKRATQPDEFTFTTIEQHEIEVGIFDKIKRFFWNFIR